jgi:hypothetical protein
MEMINRCLEITEAKREALEAFDRRKQKLEERAFLREQRSPEWGNRKQRRREAALARQGKEYA